MKKLLPLLMVFLIWNCSNVPFEYSTWAPEREDVPRFLSTAFVDIAEIENITKFRSGYGHDYPDRYESERSMKHYFKPASHHQNTDDSLEVYSPVSGMITMVMNERDTGNQIRITPDGYSYVSIVFFHIHTSYSVGDRISEGALLGYPHLINDSPDGASDFDVAVWLNSGHLISVFDIMDDSVFNPIAAKFSQTDRKDFQFSKGYRDINPVSGWSDSSEDWIIPPGP